MKTAAASAALLTSALRAGLSPAFAVLRYDDRKLAGLNDMTWLATRRAALSAPGQGQIPIVEILRCRQAAWRPTGASGPPSLKEVEVMWGRY